MKRSTIFFKKIFSILCLVFAVYELQKFSTPQMLFTPKAAYLSAALICISIFLACMIFVEIKENDIKKELSYHTPPPSLVCPTVKAKNALDYLIYNDDVDIIYIPDKNQKYTQPGYYKCGQHEWILIENDVL